MSRKPLRVRQTSSHVYRAESDPATLLSHLSAISKLADGEKEALGFLPEAAYRDVIEKRRLIAMCVTIGDQQEVVGFVLFSGVFPNAPNPTSKNQNAERPLQRREEPE